MSIADALVALRPGAQWNARGDSYADIEWLDQGQGKPSQAEVTAEIARQAALPAPTLADKMDQVQFKIAFKHENDIRGLKGQQPLTVAQFKTALTALFGG